MHPRSDPRLHGRDTLSDWAANALDLFGINWPSPNNSNNNGNGNGNGNGNQNTRATTTTPRTTANQGQTITSVTRQTQLTTTTTTVRAPTGDNNNQPTTSAPSNSPSPAPPVNPASSPSNTFGGENSLVNGTNSHTGTSPGGGDDHGGQQPPNFTPVPAPNGWGPSQSQGVGSISTGPSGGDGVTNDGQSGLSKGMVAGLVIGLIFLVVIGCLAAAFFIRRSRKRRAEQHQQIRSFDDTTPWIVDRESKTPVRDVEKEEVVSIDQRVSLSPSAMSQVRARTPGGSPAIPIPYEPSEVSDDVSNHFSLLQPDHRIGVPVPFPLALHVPSRVAHAMSERDERWRQYELQRQMQGKADDLSETSTIPRPPSSRVPNRRSTLRSVASTGTTPSDAYAGMESPRNSGRSAWEQPDYFGSELERSRSEVAAEEQRNSPLNRGGQSGRSSMMSEFPSPPLPSLQQSHRRDGSLSNIRRLPPLPPAAATRGSTEVFPFVSPTENAENPFATDANINSGGMSNISERSSLAGSDERSDELTVTHHSEESQGVVGSITGVARAVSARNMRYLGRSSTSASRGSRNPFADGPSRFSAADSVLTNDDRTIDTHQFHGLVSGFPTPPDPTSHRL